MRGRYHHHDGRYTGRHLEQQYHSKRHYRQYNRCDGRHCYGHYYYYLYPQFYGLFCYKSRFRYGCTRHSYSIGRWYLLRQRHNICHRRHRRCHLLPGHCFRRHFNGYRLCVTNSQRIRNVLLPCTVRRRLLGARRQRYSFHQPQPGFNHWNCHRLRGLHHYPGYYFHRWHMVQQ